MTDTNPPALVKMTEDEFDTKYEPIGLSALGDGTLWREAHEVPEDVADHCIWTVVEGDEGTYYQPGWHPVNHIAFVITKVPWEHEHIEVKVDEVEEDGAPCCPAPQDHDTKDGTCDFPGYADNH